MILTWKSRELLKNIRRKSADPPHLVTPSGDFAVECTSRGKFETDAEELLQENLQYKRIQKDLCNQLHVVERKSGEIQEVMSNISREMKEKE